MMSNLIPTIGTIAIKANKILLVQEGEKSEHITGMYGLASGRVEKGETELDAAVREFGEETGLIADKKDFKEFNGNYFVASIQRKEGTVIKMGWRVYKVENFSGNLKRDDETAPQWFTIEEIEQMEKEGKLLPNVLKAIQLALKNEK